MLSPFYHLDEDKVVVLYNKKAYPKEDHHNDGLLTLFAYALAKQAKLSDDPEQIVHNFFKRNDLMQMNMKFSRDALLDRCLNTLAEIDADNLKREILQEMGETNNAGRNMRHL